ncbi:Anaerobic selenocysteine-containing dehydrogenase [Sphingopyxis sp. YR583]|uniref:molybdopterin-containing oxidoreductase family protein n=1 Tax=Sphingopyxis sp. YR583 TaxID=1881047 RepID=UPI0008A78BC1|nr:molybdopterin dinucleotide binding domain-containing protein [Sphingopyxis sp. YR583]SEH19218.1 Anaerobic selenocysteine-containing dehydrogenase [Sphingopyxis sp. YR583]
MIKVTSTCRSCLAYCPVDVTIDEGNILKVEGNHRAPLYEGFICPKGRALTDMHNDPRRLLHSLKRQPDGSYAPISNADLVKEVAEKVARLMKEDGPRTVAAYVGSVCGEQQASAAMTATFLQAIGSPMLFSASTIDQPGILVADALHGVWSGGRMRPEDLEVFVLVGGNPIISKQYFSQNPGQQLKRLVKGGMKLVVIDPRRTETARRAAVHLQCIPGEDPTILAGLIHLILGSGHVDSEFVEMNAKGLAALDAAVAPFTPQYVAERAGVDEKDLREAARIIGEARTGDIGTGTGPSMATRGTLTAYLAACLQTVRGFWAREGQEQLRPSVLLPPQTPKAQPAPTYPAWGFGTKLRGYGFQETAAGMPVAGLVDEILTPGEGRVRALFLHAGASITWPDEKRSNEALDALDLLVAYDIAFSATSRRAHYVIATALPFEVPVMSHWPELMGRFHNGYGWGEPYAAYQPALVKPPPGSDIMEAWQLYYRMAKHLGIPLGYTSFGADQGLPDGESAAVPMDMTNEPSTDEIYGLITNNSAVPFERVKAFPDGHLFDEARRIVGPRDPECDHWLNVANQTMLDELATVRAEDFSTRVLATDFPFLLIPRRVQSVTNAGYRPEPPLGKNRHNPAYLHSAALARLGLKNGDFIEIMSRGGSLQAFVEADDDLRDGVVSMSHGFGNPGDAGYDPRRDGANTNRLIRWDDDFDPYHGMPRMGAIPVSIRSLVEA